MKLCEVIDKVSVLYREERKKTTSLQDELNSILADLEEVRESKGENITLEDYNYLLKRKDFLAKEVEIQTKYCDGIACAREILMDLGFDTEIIG
jgi:ElaB/YqjD/DUF883 family membrane-anchored ribosome-binding protein